jgi:hypothetical protein
MLHCSILLISILKRESLIKISNFAREIRVNSSPIQTLINPNNLKIILRTIYKAIIKTQEIIIKRHDW